jgi:hypothetical protein
VAVRVGSLSPETSERMRRQRGGAVTYAAKSEISWPPRCSRWILGEPTLRSPRGTVCAVWATHGLGSSKQTREPDRAARALPDQEQRKWTGTPLEAAPRWRAGIY